MDSVSVVIPTMWRSKRAPGLISDLCSCGMVREVIVIDNDVKSRPEIEDSDKILFLDQDENIYVNPAWNLGVSKSSSPVCMILNDDITFDVDHIASFYRGLSMYNVVGVHPKSYDVDSARHGVITPGHHIGKGWGCAICFETKEWVDIPDQMKIWRGDMWVQKQLGNPGSVELPIETEMSTTSNMPEMSEIKMQDLIYWKANVR